jgi:cation transporter-like permease
VANDTAVPLNRTERILRNMIASAAGLSILAMIATIIGSTTGANRGGGIWVTIAVLPFIGLIIAAVLIVAFAVVSIARRRRLARDDR